MTDTAKSDLRSIRKHIAKENPKAAKAFVKDLTDKLYALAANGVTGSPHDYIRQELHGFPYRGRCFYFHIVDDKMFVVRVLHGSQDIGAQAFPYDGARKLGSE
ncbi:MAG: type II toxin-antitoxin system RelE/ParE family toxin [Sedimenticola sp.]